MSPKNYLKIIKANKTKVYACIVLTAIIALAFSVTRPVSFNTTISYDIHSVNRQNTDTFQYDNFYAIQAAELLSNTVVGWVESPEVVFSAYDKAGLAPNADQIDRLVKGMKAKQISSHLVKVEFNQENRENSEKLAGALAEVVNEKVKKTELTSDNKNSFEVIASNPMISEKTYDPVLITLLGLVCGLFIGLGVAFLFEYLKEE